ncbi:DUF5641 domain-containing protein [Trichonephila inaurata madagascariensis]|uniref:DUF5641 domain-containing protein n=1 Tax=Trichonephila inaurata madagascariensis TaxID=2747483 RepID=A0A8X6YCV6_9ARAC|nr:DUF5641 domain-containing protein [Trichonephila inaurata madagascariensis]
MESQISDFFSFSVSLQEQKCAYSKREVLSEIARVFDPLGLLSPCVVFMKILLQELWKLNLEWDEPIPEDLNKQWAAFRKELHLIEKMKIPSRSPVSRTFGYLKSSELHTAVVTIVSLIPQAEFPNEIKCLVQGNPLPKDNKLLPLNLFCDSEGVLRVGGRLSRNTRLSYDQKHPMFLPKNHEFTRKIEACLNSRPLTELSPDPSDFNALTPAHFLVGGPIHQFPEPSQPSRSVALSERWNLIQRLRRYFWDRWSTEYLHRLQPRSKWWRTKPNLQLGDMVIVEKEQTAPLNWTVGRINKLFFGPDQKVRVVSVNTKYGQLTRNVNKIYLLPNSQEI